MNDSPHLSISGLRTYFFSQERGAFIHSVDGVDLNVPRGSTLGIVGESGSGKSVTMLSIMGLVPNNPGVVQGNARLYTDDGEINLLPDLSRFVDIDGDKDIVAVRKDTKRWKKQLEKTMGPIRGRRISMIFQNPKAALNPFSTIGRQIDEMIRLHRPQVGKHEIRERTLHWLERVKIDEPAKRYHAFPAELSGGMCQRAMIAMALASEPELLIADEPTTGLDATIQASIVELLDDLKRDLGITMIIISHDISVISALSDNISVMYGGQVLEHGPAQLILNGDEGSRHPYTAALLDSVPNHDNVLENGKLKSIAGEVPDTVIVPRGCRFADRCHMINDSIRYQCHSQRPILENHTPNHTIRCWRQQS